jgi:putative transposase
VRLVQRHVIKGSHSRFFEIDEAAFKSKNLYNSAVYICRQAVFAGLIIPSMNELYHQLKNRNDYTALPAKVSQLVIKQVAKSFKSYVEAKKAYCKDNSKFTGEPRLPNYKPKEKGRNTLYYNYQAFSKKMLKKGWINPSGLEVKIKTNLTKIDEVRIIPRGDYYVLEAIYTQKELPQRTEGLIASIDLGLNNLATVCSNNTKFKPFIVSGKAIKSANQWYNKRLAKFKASLPEDQYSSKKIRKITFKRNNKVDYYLHTSSRYIINTLLERGVTHLVIGKNEGWKQNINIGKKNNQNFVQVPHAKFIDQLIYKANLVGMIVTLTEESYTSKCSFLDLEPLVKQAKYLGRRVKRGLFKSSSGKKINADQNGALNILRKVVGNNVFDINSIERLVVSPVMVYPFKA